MKVLAGLVAILIVLFVGGFLFSGMTDPQVTQTEITRDIDMKSLETSAPAVAPNPTPAPVADISETPVMAPVVAAPAVAPVTTTPSVQPTTNSATTPTTTPQGE
jgi:hypothetical protein